ncbi:MAG: right-handed parallel beta-helix repeat-containing protein [Lewinellaceae bacterium]|nr:right-handed parallel beta-helix repeat-containing protein [Lewinellaceae bacterium]
MKSRFNFAVRTETAGSGSYNITLNSNRYGTTDDGLKAAYSGQSPAPLDKGFAGLFLQGAGNLNIGTDVVSSLRNEFFNLKYGILSYNTDLTVRNTVFHDITSVPKGAGYNDYANLIATGKAVYAQGGAVDIKGGIISSDPPVVFDNCHTGVHTLYTSANVEETTMSGMTNGIISNGGAAADAEWNNITASDRGISTAFLSGVGAHLSVKYNTITLQGNEKGIGIGAGGSDLFPQNEGTVQDNTVTVEDGATGIGITTSNKIQVSENTVTLTGDTPLFGIKVEGGDRNTVNCNTVTNTGSGNNDGIFAIHPSRANFVCNTIEGTARGLQFEGMLAGKQKANVAKNALQNNSDAGLLLGTDAVVGEQRHKGNKWSGGVTKALHLTPQLADLSLFTVDDVEETEFMPDVIVPQDWFLNEPTSTATDGNCEPGVTCPIATEPPGDVALDRKIARSELGGTTYQAAQQWLAQRRLYEKLTEEGNAYIGDPDFDTFLTQAQSSGLSQYAGVQAGIRQLGGMSENDRIAAVANLLSQNSNLAVALLIKPMKNGQ